MLGRVRSCELLLAVLHEEDAGNVLEVPAALTTLILHGLKS